MNKEIRTNSKWEALEDFKIYVGSDTRNHNYTSVLIKKGTFLFWEDDALNGNVWFNVEIEGIKYRGKKESGCILNLVKRDLIKLIDNGQSFVIYSQNYVNKYLNT
jgi:hypothetical protein